jgi:hypothetical protein
MTPDRASGVIVGSMAVTAVLASVTAVRSGRVPAPRIVVGALAAAIALNLVAEVAPAPAAGVAVMVLIGTLVGVSGAGSVAAIGKAVSSGPAHPHEQVVSNAHPEFFGSPK